MKKDPSTDNGKLGASRGRKGMGVSQEGPETLPAYRKGEERPMFFRMRVESLDGTLQNTKICDPDTGEEFDNVALRAIMPAIDGQGTQYWKALVEVDWPEVDMDLKAAFPDTSGSSTEARDRR